MHWPPDPAAFAAVFLFLYLAHGIADHWLQTDWEATNKGRRDRFGRRACLRHVVTYTLCTAIAVLSAVLLFDLDVAPLGLLAGQLVSAITHYWADRRYTLEGLCDLLGKGNFYRLGRPRSVAAWTQRAGEQGEVGHDHDVKLYADTLDAVSWDNPSLGTGAYVLDQWWHLAWLGVAAIVTVAL